jgi:hypothetical protein
MKLATAINANTYRAIVPTLKLADISSASLLDTLLANGVGTRKDAVPYVVFYVTQLPKVTRKPYEGQRGWTFGRGTAEQKTHRQDSRQHLCGCAGRRKETQDQQQD